jgi:hypothetical protein
MDKAMKEAVEATIGKEIPSRRIRQNQTAGSGEECSMAKRRPVSVGTRLS